MDIEVRGLDELIKQLKDYKKRLTDRKKTFLERLAKIGIDRATVEFKYATYDGKKDVEVDPHPVWVDENTLLVRASGETVLFIEFGSGLIGSGHPKPLEYGPGTWSEGPEGKKHWDDPRGWFYAHGEKSYGNRPAMAMYYAGREMREKIIEIAREVFTGD